MAFTAITTEGALFPADLLERLAAGVETAGQRPEDFGLKSGQRLSDEMQAAFADIRSQWDAYQRRLRFSKESRTTLTRESWVVPLLERLGFSLEYQRRAATAGADTFDFSHRAGPDPEAPPVHIIADNQELDKRGETRRSRSPHALVQEYLNRSDTLWGLVTNGDKLRLLRNTARLARPTYVEFDLRAMVESNLYSEFVLLYRLLHRTRFPLGAPDAHECWLEKYYQQGLDEGGRVREHLREGVEVAIQELGTAFLAHPDSQALREALKSGRLRPEEYYRQLLRLVYRLLFLMVSEERRLLFPPEAPHPERQEIYTRYYSINRLRQRCERRFADDRFSDLWVGLRQTFRLLQSEAAARQLGLAPLDGELFGPFACPDLEGASCENARLLQALYHLSTFTDRGVRRRVNYAGLDTEELGSIYESLLDYHPQISLADPPRFELAWGSERKQTGSYYTPPELVRELIESALAPVMEKRLAAASTPEEKEAALRSLKICDPASGSGHFLLAAARRLGQELARIRTGEAEPAPEAYREAVRDIIRECLYAVDKNPLAVDLCKVALWLEGHCAGLPLSFLDHHVKCGDSLVGVMDLAALEDGIPDDAYKPVTGDDKQAAAQYKRRNKEERERQASLFQEQLAQAADGPRALAPDFAALAELAELTPRDVQAKSELYEALRRGSTWLQLQVACDLWTAAFFSHLTGPSSGRTPLAPTTAMVWGYLSQPATAHGQVVGKARELSAFNRFFHWPLEFPEVFAAGGFDVVLGNPPWERIKLQEKEFFVARDLEIAQCTNASIRKRLIAELPKKNPSLWTDFLTAKRIAECESHFLRNSGRFPLSAVGDINTYQVFADLSRQLISRKGRSGIIVPTGIATDDTTKFFFQKLMDTRTLVSLFDFENRQGIFPGVHRSYKFCLLTLSGDGRPEGRGAEFAFFLQQVTDLKDDARRFVLSRDDISLLNPNTHTCPLFRNKNDAEITRAIYRRIPVLLSESDKIKECHIIQSTMFHSMIAAHLFTESNYLEFQEYQLQGNIYKKEGSTFLPLYEGKTFMQFDHRFADIIISPSALARPAQPQLIGIVEHQDHNRFPQPRAWVNSLEVDNWCNQKDYNRLWFPVYKKITSSTNERTVIATILPKVAITDTIHIILFTKDTRIEKVMFLLACLNSFPLDYIARQKLGGNSLNFYTMNQLPIIPYNHEMKLSETIGKMVLELCYTSWDLESFAKDFGYIGPPFQWDEDRRFLLRCELDAAFFHLYGLSREEADYILDTFPIVKRKDEARYGEYRTKRVIQEIYDDLQRSMSTGEPYRTRLDPPPGDPRAAHAPGPRES